VELLLTLTTGNKISDEIRLLNLLPNQLNFILIAKLKEIQTLDVSQVLLWDAMVNLSQSVLKVTLPIFSEALMPV